MHALHLPAFEYRRMRWKNNLGWTREICRAPDQDDYDWRVSIAEIDHYSEFSAFPGHDRILVLLEGNGMRLHFAGGDTMELRPPHARVAFRGEERLRCELIDGPTRDFNLIWRRDRMRAELLHRPLVGPMVFFPEAGVQWLLYVLGGRARLKDRADVAPLEQGDSLLLWSEAAANERAILDGGAELLLARLAPR
jgi:environmental stress-induced protein Ves